MLEGVKNFKEEEKAFFSIAFFILTIGLVMVYSSSYIFAVENYGKSSYFFIRQLTNTLIGIMVFTFVSVTKFKFWIKYSEKIHLFAFCLILLTFLPGIGISIKGSNRWINLFVFQFQPGEFLKYSTVLMATNFFVNFETFSVEKILKSLLILFAPIFILALQPDFGTFVICFGLIIFCCFLSSFPRKIFYGLFTFSGILGAIILTMADYRVKRMLTFLDPWKDPKSSGFQIIQSYLAFSNGGFFGLGIGNSNEKLLYLPEAHNDFIFSVLGEELGFVGVLIVVALYASLIFYGFKISLKVKVTTAQILVAGIIFLIGLQAMFNMGVVLGLLPTKGLNLPFISYGGSSLICNFLGLGLIVSAIKHNQTDSI